MSLTSVPRPADQIARVGTDWLARIEPTLPSNDLGRHIAVDVNSGEYEVDDDDYAAVHRLHARVPSAEVWVSRVGGDAADQM